LSAIFSRRIGASSAFLRHYDEAPILLNSQPQICAIGADGEQSDDGKAVHAGTTDILDDFDAGYIIDELSLSGYPGQKFVEFQRLKARGGGVQSVAYTYAGEDHVSYAQRLASVRLVDQDDLDGIKRVEAERSDADLIATVAECITAGVDTKMALRNAVADKAGVSRRAATRIIEHYTGDDPAQHRWHFVRKARGAMTFALLDKEGAAPASV